MPDSYLTTRPKEVFISERPILWQAYLDLTEFSRTQVVPASVMAIAAFIAALITGQVTSISSALLFIVCSVVAGVLFYFLIAIVRAPFIVIGQHHRQLSDVNQRLVEVEARSANALLPALLPAETQKKEPEPNLVCLRCETVPCSLSSSKLFVEGPYGIPVDKDRIYRACVAVIDNKTDRSRKVGSAHDVSARIVYPFANGTFEVSRGAWLSESSSKVTIYASRPCRLILAVVPDEGPSCLHGVELNQSDAYGLTATPQRLNVQTMTICVTLESGGVILGHLKFTLTQGDSGPFASSYERVEPEAM